MIDHVTIRVSDRPLSERFYDAVLAPLGIEQTAWQLGIGLGIIWPGQSGSRYHGEDAQEDFLVLSGECLLLVEGEERRLRAWDLVNCPPWTEHAVVGAGHGPCLVLAVGARIPGRGIRYPVSDLALRHGAGVARETTDPREAYADFRPDRKISAPPEFPPF